MGLAPCDPGRSYRDNAGDLESHEVVKQIKVCENTRRGDNDACSAWDLHLRSGANVSAR